VVRPEEHTPSGTTLPNGVEVKGLGPIGVSITETFSSIFGSSLEEGTLTGFPSSSATNWTTGSASYQVILHCTNDSTRGY
jgi:hypothetical protein